MPKEPAENAPRLPSLPSSDLLTVAQAANYLQISSSSIRAYIREGKLKAFQVAGARRVRIPRQELMRLLSLM